MISIITAFDNNQLIGRDNSLPWCISEDLKYFKEKTIGKKVIMGFKTFYSLGKPLPNRENIILTRDNLKKYNTPSYYFVNDYTKILDTELFYPNEEFMVIGGAEVYKLFLQHAGKLYITKIDREYEGNIYFPEIDYSEWNLIKSTPGSEGYYTFMEYERKMKFM